MLKQASQTVTFFLHLSLLLLYFFITTFRYLDLFGVLQYTTYKHVTSGGGQLPQKTVFKRLNLRLFICLISPKVQHTYITI